MSDMDRYLIETPHEVEECTMLFSQLRAMGYLYHFDWGRKAGVRSGWATIAATNEQQAQMAGLPLVCHKARVITLNRFDPADEKTLHGAQA